MTNPTIDDVRNLLQLGHQLNNDTPEETLNRLWVKHLNGRKERYGKAFIESAPKYLEAKNTLVSSEDWSSEDLSVLICTNRTRPLVGDENAPIIIKYRDQNCLIDGGRRITKWRRQSPSTMHTTWIIAIRENEESG